MMSSQGSWLKWENTSTLLRYFVPNILATSKGTPCVYLGNQSRLQADTECIFVLTCSCRAFATLRLVTLPDPGPSQHISSFSCTTPGVPAMGSPPCHSDLQRMEPDPLEERLDTVLKAHDGGEKVAVLPTELPSSIEDILRALKAQPGVEEVSLGRQASAAPSTPLTTWHSKAARQLGAV